MIDASSASPVRAVDGELDKLMAAYQKADVDGTVALIGAVSPLLYRFFFHQCGNAEDAADLLQDTWLRVHKVRHTYRPGEPVLPWLYAIARHTKVDGYRRKRRILSREKTMDSVPEARVPFEPIPASMPSFDALMSELPQSQREVVTLLKVTGMSLEEVARATSSSIGSVKQKAHRAYERLRRVLAPAVKDNRETRSNDV